MRIEKINDNKLKIILSKEDLANHNISPQSLKEQNLENNELFMDILCEAEEEFNISLAGFPLLIEGSANAMGEFIFIVTRLKKEPIHSVSTNKEKIKTINVKSDLDNKYLIYCFKEFDNILDFVKIIEIAPKTFHNVLYEYNNMYYLIIKNTKTVKSLVAKLNVIIADFANIIPYPILFKNRLEEYGNKCINDNAINTIKNY